MTEEKTLLSGEPMPVWQTVKRISVYLTPQLPRFRGAVV